MPPSIPGRAAGSRFDSRPIRLFSAPKKARTALPTKNARVDRLCETASHAGPAETFTLLAVGERPPGARGIQDAPRELDSGRGTLLRLPPAAACVIGASGFLRPPAEARFTFARCSGHLSLSGLQCAELGSLWFAADADAADADAAVGGRREDC